MSELHRIVVLVTPEQLSEIKGNAGLVPLSVWIKSKILGLGPLKQYTDFRGTEAFRTSQPGSESGNGKTDSSENTAGPPDLLLAKRSTGSDRRGVRRNGGTLGRVENVAHQVARERDVAPDHGSPAKLKLCEHAAAAGLCKFSKCKHHASHQ